ncbi:MAG: hypothetical protein V4467_03675 [Patescibacteria group bacterium]
MFVIERDKHNPILSPEVHHEWESAGSFNWCPIPPVGKSPVTAAVYRAQSESKLQDGVRRSVSTIGLAQSSDGQHFDNRQEFITPEHEWEKFGCEDARVTTFNKIHYIFYTALSMYPVQKDGIRIALAKVNEKMEIMEKHSITPFNAKAMALFPKKIGGKFAALLTIRTDEPPSEICYVEFEKESDMWNPEFWEKWKRDISLHTLNVRRGNNEQVELGAPPILTSLGWLVVYSHIQNYFQGDRSFGVEALLLDKNNPRLIIGRTKGSFLVPEEYYERVGQVPNIIFPTGAIISDENLEIYYGAADTHSCIARVNLKKFLASMVEKKPLFVRGPNNPIISPRPDKAFETRGTFNPASVEIDGKIYIFYRAVSSDNISTFGLATSLDGFSIDERSEKPIYTPRVDFESKGCEDPRATLIKDRVHVFYTAYDGNTPRVAGTSISVKDLQNGEWNWSTPSLITFASVGNKDACILPKKINGKYMIIHRIDDLICADFVDSLDWKNEPVRTCIPLLHPRRGMWDGGRIGLACPPVETKKGWLFFYHGVSNTTHYRVGVALLDKNDPTVVLARSVFPIFEPVEDYEWKGIVPGVVFPCGVIERGDTLFFYYGAADLVVGVATAKTSELLKMLETPDQK